MRKKQLIETQSLVHPDPVSRDGRLPRHLPGLLPVRPALHHQLLQGQQAEAGKQLKHTVDPVTRLHYEQEVNFYTATHCM